MKMCIEIVPELWKLRDFELLSYEEALLIPVERWQKRFELVMLQLQQLLWDEVVNYGSIDLVAFYISDRSSYITGVTTNITGGKPAVKKMKVRKRVDHSKSMIIF